MKRIETVFPGTPTDATRGMDVAHDVARSLPSSKVKDVHQQRKAIVYIRQSTPQQVLEHRESADRQYSLVHRAALLGWPPDRVEIVDEDQGRSGQSAEGRLGFQYLLAEIGLDHVGLILGLEMSRLARSNKDWHQLLELCAIFRTLLADQDGLYDPTDYNDRLLLGLKGTMSEAELHILRSRMYQGLLNKARRGEVYNHPPSGYVKLPTGNFTLDPDEHRVTVKGTDVNLPLKEFEVLHLLLANAGRVLTREVLIDRVWGSDYVGDTKTLDVHIKRVRAKIEDDPSQPTRIVTIRGLGYKFERPVANS